jgi:hypothetical protein
MGDSLRYGPKETPPFAFCESVHAGGGSRWHLRAITPTVGLKLGGGIDTKSLCGSVDRGWDLDVKITEGHLEEHVCLKCLDEYRKRTK